MRMTNKIMQNNSLYNINNNKIQEDKLSTQMSTNKKIAKPSDDPVIAIRALRLRTSVSEITQYYEKNAPDANSWLDVTGKSLATVTKILTSLTAEATSAANMNKAPEDIAIYLEQIKSLRDEFYSVGNEDYAGRFVFTGYKTETPLTFKEEDETRNMNYNITEQITLKDFDNINYTDIADLEGLNSINYGGITVTKQDIVTSNIHRIRLSYDATKAGSVPSITKSDGTPLVTGITEVSTGADPDPYQQIQDANKNGLKKAIYVPETGEVLFSDLAYTDLEAATGPNDEIRVNYDKNSWKSGDLRPDHYFACTSTVVENGVTTNKNYNPDYLTTGKSEQKIEYDVGYNQKIHINTTADQVFVHGLDRDIDDLENAYNSLNDIYKVQTDLKNVLKGLQEGSPNYAKVQAQLEAADRAYTDIRNNIHNKFQNTITKVQGYSDKANLAITDNGTKSQRLDLVSNRLMDQKSTFKTLQSENEDIDLSEVTVQLTSANLSYQSALMATGKILQESLMNYI